MPTTTRNRMENVLQRLPQQESTASTSARARREEVALALLEFLAWIEKSKGLVLCQAFKPQYDWYMPAFANNENLVRDFLGKSRPADRDP